MIKYTITQEKTRYNEEIVISKKNYLFVKRCLEINSLEEMSDKELKAWDYKKDDNRLIFIVDFDNNSIITWRLCSGSINYYDEVILEEPNGKSYVMTGAFDLDDVLIETPTDIYYVKLVIK